MNINITIDGNKKGFDSEDLKKFLKPVVWAGSFKWINGTINSMCRPTRNLGYIFNAITSAELATFITARLFNGTNKDENVTEIDPETEDTEDRNECTEEDFVDESN